MAKLILSTIICLFISNVLAKQPQTQAEFFFKNYLTLCAMRINDFDQLRKQLQSMPKLPENKARAFNMPFPIDAYPVPSPHGYFILAVAKEKSVCAFFARRGDGETVRKDFIHFFKAAPKPLTAELKEDSIVKHKGFTTQRIAYTWGLDTNKKVLFMLSTTASENAPMQLLATANVVSD